MPDVGEEHPGVQAAAAAGTPSASLGLVSDETLASLEFAAAVAAVAAHAVSVPGGERVRGRRPIADPERVADELTTVGELADRLRAGNPFRPEPVDDVRGRLDAAAPDGAVLDGPALLDVARTVTAARLVSEQLDRLETEAPRTAALRTVMPDPALESLLCRMIDDDGRIPDGADRDVDRARGRVREARSRLHAQLDRALKNLEAHETTADATVTMRGGRYVIPVARDARGRLPGIVHDESSSGATLFVEPQAAVELGNALRAAESELVRVERAVYRKLTAAVRDDLTAVRAGWDMCVRVDDLFARARYAQSVDGVPPALTSSPGALQLRAARHPLLLAEGVAAVPFDLELTETELAVIVSGPNTGGKTVLLKAIGLICTLVQSGIVPPIGDRSRMPVFSRVVADIGDHQSIEASLSTFSAHVVALRRALDRADAGTLVLLDEVGSGTDPREGAALAGAAVLALIASGARTVATTHLTELKDLATRADGVVNASLEFDVESLEPTFRLLKGLPGRSYGLVIARRLGLPEHVLQDAEARVPEGERSLDALLADVEARAAVVRDLEAQLADQALEQETGRERAARQAADLDARARVIEQREKELEREGRAQARRFLLDARRRVEDALGAARAAVNEATAKEARRLVEEGISREAEELRRLEEELEKKGWTVRGRSARSAGTPVRPSSSPPKSRLLDDASALALGAVSEVDVRGLSADEAREAVLRAVDAAVVADLPALRIIHGKGTGRLRALVREMMDADLRVRQHRTAPPLEGGTGVTIVELVP